MGMETRIFPDLDSRSRAAMDQTMEILRTAVAQSGRFSIALSGGHTPAKVYELWASKPYRGDTPGIGFIYSGATSATSRTMIRSAITG
jgi:6-phosphogluconolactonase/glucosamine-6-phosphate isomerase/deaminase